MAAFKSLYDSLLEQGLIEPDAPSAAPAEPHLVSLTGKAFAEAVLQSKEFRLYIIEGLTERDLPPAVLCRLIDHAWGKPVERVQVQEIPMLDGLSVEELRAHLRERMVSLQTMMGMLEENGLSSIH